MGAQGPNLGLGMTSIFKRTVGTLILAPDPDPNTLIPVTVTSPTGFANGSAVEGQPFSTGEKFKNATSSAILLAMARTPSGVSAANVSAWWFDQGHQAATGSDFGAWILAGKITVAEGTPQVVPGIRGPDVIAYMQVNSISGISGMPGALLGYVIPQP